MSKKPRMAKMDPSAAKMAIAVWNGYVWDAREDLHVSGAPSSKLSGVAMLWVS